METINLDLLNGESGRNNAKNNANHNYFFIIFFKRFFFKEILI